jgi:replicative DNA helicase
MGESSDKDYSCTEHYPNFLKEALEDFYKKNKEKEEDGTYRGVIFLTTREEAKKLLEESKSNNLDNTKLKYSVSIMINPPKDETDRIREFKNALEETLKSNPRLCKDLPFLSYKLEDSVKTEVEEILRSKIGWLGSGNEHNKELEKTAKDAIIKDTSINTSINSMCVSTSLPHLIEKLKNKSANSIISTGFKELDDALNGGIRTNRLYGIGGIPAVGKTTFVMNVADNVASSGQDVLVFGLEMTKEDLMMKGIARQMFLSNDSQKNISGNNKFRELPTAIELSDKIYPNIDKKESNYEALGIKSKTKQEEEKLKDLLQKAEAESKKLGEHLYICGVGFDNVNTDTIKNVLNNFAKVNNRIPKLVIVDYLQIMSPCNPRFNTSEKQNIDKSISELKKISGDFDTSVIVVSSFNRENYYKEVSLKSFKESGGIEYSCDVLIGLQLKMDYSKLTESNDESKKQQIDSLMKKFPREIEFVILKNRMYEIQERVQFEYYTKFDCFTTDNKSRKKKSPKSKDEDINMKNTGTIDYNDESVTNNNSKTKSKGNHNSSKKAQKEVEGGSDFQCLHDFNLE